MDANIVAKAKTGTDPEKAGGNSNGSTASAEMSTGCSAGSTRAFEGTGIVVEQSSVTASTPNRRNSGHRCATRGRTGPPLEDRSGEPVAGT